MLAVDQPYPNHNGGLLLFGPDGDLYIGLGDGGAGGDPERNGLDLSTLLGKILRIDPDARRRLSPTRSPPTTRSSDQDGARPEIYSYGLRNPWRFSFDRETGDLSIGDVGQDARRGDRPRRPRARARARTSAGRRSRATSASTTTRTPTERSRRCSTAAARRRQLLDHRRPRRPRPAPDDALRPLPLRRPLRRRAAQLHAAARSEPATDDVALGPDVDRLASFGEGADGTVYAVSISGPGLPARPGALSAPARAAQRRPADRRRACGASPRR